MGRAQPPAVPPTCRIRRRRITSPHTALDRNGTQTSDSVLPVTGETPAERSRSASLLLSVRSSGGIFRRSPTTGLAPRARLADWPRPAYSSRHRRC